jgi:Metal-dependent hydrolases of the beta-lactamase superfamily I
LIKVTVFGSGSSGNCYLLDNGTDQLMIEAGLSYKKVAPKMEFDFSKVRALLISHEHQDHAKYAKEFINHSQAILIASKGTLQEMYAKGWADSFMSLPMADKMATTMGTFNIQTFAVEHDANEPLGFLITSGDDRLVYVTDTYFVKYKFKGITQMMVEMNYSKDVLDEEVEQGIETAKLLRNRVYSSHFEMQNSLEFIKTNMSKALQQVILIHVSSTNADPELFKSSTQRLTGVPVYLANEMKV